ncbi:hypothetical protein [Brevibacterium oceani]|uniref:hypothetical protein n=1 Tax=Brevibacterium oceani TaxID=358099 RepID=UPI0015E6ABF4|nr:hypothetical protein [Brevibacterium oceani]
MIQPHHITQACRRTQDALLIATEKPSPKPQNGGGGGSSIEAPLPLPVGLISAKRELADWLADWCSLVRDGLEVVATYDLDEHSRLEWLGSGERAEFLANHETAQDFLDEITVLTKQLENPYLPRAGKKYIGFYGGGNVYIRDGQTEVTLEDGETHRVADLRAYNAAHMLDTEGTASDVAEIIKTFFGHDITPQKITVAHRNDKTRKEGKRLEPIRKEGNSNIYRVWDVLNRLC